MGVGFLVWVRGDDGGGLLWCAAMQVEEIHRMREPRKKKRGFVVIFELRRAISLKGKHLYLYLFYFTELLALDIRSGR